MGGDLKKHLTLDFMVNYTPVSANIGDSEFYFRDMTDMDDDHFLFLNLVYKYFSELFRKSISNKNISNLFIYFVIYFYYLVTNIIF